MSRDRPIDGYFFEDYSLGEIFRHAVPRTVTESDATLYMALVGERPDTLEDQMRLNRRASRRVDRERHGFYVAHAKRALKRTGNAGHGQPGPQRRRNANRAGEPDDGNDRNIVAEARRNERPEHRAHALHWCDFRHRKPSLFTTSSIIHC